MPFKKKFLRNFRDLRNVDLVKNGFQPIVEATKQGQIKDKGKQ